jgi:EAL and modified HD-GYP domain-containing signal transduction protein
MCELMAEELNSDRAAAFTVGMLSALEILLAVPVTELVSRLAVTDELKSALLGREGRLGSLLGDALDWQDWEIDAPLGPVASGLESASLERAYLSAVDWAETSVTALFD